MTEPDEEPTRTAPLVEEAPDNQSEAPHKAVARLLLAARRRKVNFNIANTAAYTGLMFTVAWMWWMQHQVGNAIPPFSLPLTWALTTGYFVAMIITFAYTWRGTREVKESIQAITESTEMSAVGPLLETMEMGEPIYDLSTLGWSDRPIVGMAARALTQLLPRLQASDAPRLTPHQRARLYRALELSALAPAKGRRAWRGNPAFAIAALCGLEQIGDHRALPVVAQLAKNARAPQVREAAAACLPALQARVTLEQSNATLLRAADRAQDITISPDLLLRPAFTGNATDPTELLRAAVQEGDRPAEEETERLLEALQNLPSRTGTRPHYTPQQRATGLPSNPLLPQPAEERPQSLHNGA